MLQRSDAAASSAQCEPSHMAAISLTLRGRLGTYGPNCAVKTMTNGE